MNYYNDCFHNNKGNNPDCSYNDGVDWHNKCFQVCSCLLCKSSSKSCDYVTYRLYLFIVSWLLRSSPQCGVTRSVIAIGHQTIQNKRQMHHGIDSVIHKAQIFYQAAVLISIQILPVCGRCPCTQLLPRPSPDIGVSITKAKWWHGDHVPCTWKNVCRDRYACFHFMNLLRGMQFQAP